MSDSTTTTQTDAETVAALQRDWIFGWNIEEGTPPREFREVFGRFYDFDADVILFDEADPELRTFRRVQDYADAFWPTFTALLSAKHAIPEGPEVLVSGDLAVGRMVFTAVLTAADGTVTSLTCRNSMVWKRDGVDGWRVIRDQTAVHPIPYDEAMSHFV